MKKYRSIECLPLMMSFADLAKSLPERSHSSSFDFDIPRAHPPSSMSLSVIETGYIESTASRAFSGGSAKEARMFGLYAVLLQHEKGSILIDSGAGRNSEIHRQKLPWLMKKTTRFCQKSPAAQQLSEHGFAPSSLHAILLTHAHWDHISGVEDFEGTPVWMSGEEAAFIKSRHRSMKVANGIEYISIEELKFSDTPYLGFDASCDVWGDGSLVVVPAPGHTPGSVIAFVSLPSGQRIAFIGDIVWQMEGIDLEVPKPWLSRLIADYAPSEVIDLIHRLADLKRRCPDMLFVPAHDQKMMSHLPMWPRTTLSH